MPHHRGSTGVGKAPSPEQRRDLPALLAVWSPVAVLLGLIVPALALGDHPLNPDGASYVSIADHYAAGRWDEAVNAYWSPLLSWLTAPVIAMGADPLAAFAWVQLFAAVGSLLLVASLLRLLAVTPPATAVVMFGVIGLLLEAAVDVVTPDLLLCLPLLAYVRLSADRRAFHSCRWAFVMGAVGGVAYLTKAVALPIVVVHLVTAGALRMVTAVGAEPRRVMVTWTAAVLGLALVAGPWIAVISVKTGTLTVSTAAGANVAWALPGSGGNQAFEPGLKDPPSPHAVGAWEDPVSTPGDRGGDSAIAGGVGDAARAGGQVLALLRNVGQNLAPWNAGSSSGVARKLALLALLLGGLLMAWWQRQRPEVLLVTSAAGLHAGAVLATHLEPRYLYVPILLLLIVVVPPCVGLLTTALRGRGVWCVAVVAAMALAAPFAPRTARLVQTEQHEPDIGRQLAPILEGRPVAADGVAADGLDSRNLWVCVYAGCSWHGFPEPTNDPDGLREQLLDGGIDYYLSWTPGVTTAPAGAAVVDGVNGGGHLLTVSALEP